MEAHRWDYLRRLLSKDRPRPTDDRFLEEVYLGDGTAEIDIAPARGAGEQIGEYVITWPAAASPDPRAQAIQKSQSRG